MIHGLKNIVKGHILFKLAIWKHFYFRKKHKYIYKKIIISE